MKEINDIVRQYEIKPNGYQKKGNHRVSDSAGF